MLDLTNKRILVTGGAGFLGSHVVDELKKVGVPEKNIVVPRSKDTDLRNFADCMRVCEGVDVVIHCAAKVGGIGYNQAKPGELFYDNIVMGTQMMEAARLHSVKKFVCLGTICSYPKFTPVPFQEKDLWNGYPEETNAPYGLAKKALLVQAQAYRQEYGMDIIFLLPVNLYGPRDNFNPESSHVIPALIKKVEDAKRAGQPFIEVWGTGRPTREFLYVEDAAAGIVLATQRYEKSDPVNLGSGMEISIKDLITTICRCMEFTGELRFNTDKPDGQPRRLLDVSRAKEEFGFTASTDFQEGLSRMIAWYRSQNP